MSPRRVLGTVALVGVFLTACGDDDPAPTGPDGCADTTVDDFPDGPYASPEDLDPADSDCATGSLASVDLSGRWSLSGDTQFSFEFPFIRESCEQGIQIQEASGYPDKLVHRDDSSLFWRVATEAEEFSFVFAVRACAIPDSDDLSVALGACYTAPGTEEACVVEQGRMKRFDRPVGEGESDGLELVSAWSGGGEPWPESLSLNVKVADGIAFVSRFGDLRLVDVSDPEHPADLGSVPADFDAGSDYNDVKLFQANGGTHAVLAGARSPIVDARDPSRPVIVGHLGEYAHSVFVRTDDLGHPLAYLATYGIDVPIYDLSDPSNPQLLERIALPAGVAVHDLYAEEDRVYLNATIVGFMVMERADGDWIVSGNLPTPYSHASWVGEAGGRRIAIAGDEGRDAHLKVVDVDAGSPAFMTQLGSYQTRPEVSIHNVMLFGSRAYLTYYQDGVRILDLTDPARPALAAYYHTWDLEEGGAGPFQGAIGLDVDLENHLVYVADMERGLIVLRETAE